MRWCVLVVVLAGCVEPNLAPCGDVLCAHGTVCVVEGRCAEASLAAPCTGLDTDAPCSTAGISAGTCQEGVCVKVACGNGVVEDGEQCDDGNNRSSDGCRSDCMVEQCGDGVLDPGEFCDCGAPGVAQPAGCLGPNSDNVSSQCDLHCSRHCGDGVITGLEECDGADLGGADCVSLGYYSVAAPLTCGAQCRFDVSECTGTCGDHIVQSPEEDCDGSAPLLTCVDYGFDLGHLTCRTSCTANLLGDCDRFGWRPIRSTVASHVWTDGNAMAVVEGGMGYYFDGTAWRTVGTASFIATNATQLAFVSDSQIWRRSGTTFTLDASLPPFNFPVIDADLDDQGHLVISTNDGVINFAGGPKPGPINMTSLNRCTVHVEDPTNHIWQDFPTKDGDGCTTSVLPDGTVVTLVGSSVFRGGSNMLWDAGVPVLLGGGGESQRVGSKVWLGLGKLYMFDTSGAPTILMPTPVTSFAVSGGSTFINTGSSIAWSNGAQTAELPIGGGRLAAGGDGTTTPVRLVSYGTSVTQVMSRGAWDVGGALPTVATGRVVRLADAQVALATGSAALSLGGAWIDLPVTSGSVYSDAWGAGADFYVASSIGVVRYQGVPPSVPSATVIAGTYAASELDGSGSVIVAIVQTRSKLVQLSGSTATDLATAPTGCVFTDVAVGPTGKVWATASCNTGGHVYAVTTTLDELLVGGSAPSGPSSIIATDVDSIVVSGNEVTKFVAGVGTQLRDVPTGALGLMNGELVALDAYNSTTATRGLIHYDPITNTWAPVRTPGAVWQSLSTAGGQLVLSTSSQMQRMLLAPVLPAALAR